MRAIITCLWLCAGSSVLYSCEKDQRPTVDKETVTVYDTVFADTVTTFILLRHAEPTGVGGNPGLSAAGQSRADALRRMLSPLSVSAVFATNLNRTIQTVEPVASEKGVAIQPYDPMTSNPLIDQCLRDYPKGVVVIAGHSNTIPPLLNAMTGVKSYADIPETEYDNLFIVHVVERGHATVTHLKY